VGSATLRMGAFSVRLPGSTRLKANLKTDNLESTVANTAQARKRVRQAEKRRQHNASLRSMMRTMVKKVLQAIQGGQYDAAMAEFKAAVPVLDRMANKGIIHKNKAARHKSRLNRRIKALAS